MATTASLVERDLRFQRLRAAMAAAGLDALIVAGKGHWWTGRGYLRYLTDFHLWGHDALLLLPFNGEPALTITSPALAVKITNRGWIDDAGATAGRYGIPQGHDPDGGGRDGQPLEYLWFPRLLGRQQ
jgi:hypothetical protein